MFQLQSLGPVRHIYLYSRKGGLFALLHRVSVKSIINFFNSLFNSFYNLFLLV